MAPILPLQYVCAPDSEHTQIYLVDDDKMKLLARDIAKKIEEELDYPGQIKVHMIRESRAVDFAK